MWNSPGCKTYLFPSSIVFSASVSMLHVKEQVFHSDLKIPTIRPQAIFTALSFSTTFLYLQRNRAKSYQSFSISEFILFFWVSFKPCHKPYLPRNLLQFSQTSLISPSLNLTPILRPLLLTFLVEEALLFLSHAPCSSSGRVCGLPIPALLVQHLS